MKTTTRSNKLETTVENAIDNHRLDSLVVGLSGGADSTALLRSLVSIRSRRDLRLTAVHCNFLLREEESDRDAQFCRQLCEELDVEIRVYECPVYEWRQTHEGSDEMACREMRYERFREVMKETESKAIAIAHNSDDQAETFFLNLMRGAGSTGLRGMRELRGDIFRPLLTISRKEIEEYLSESGQVYVTDSTNRESIFRRNFIRNKLLPLLEEEWPEARHSITRSMEILGRENDIIEWTLDKIHTKGDKILMRSTMSKYPDPPSLFRRLLEPYGVSAARIEEIVRTIDLPYSGRRWELGDGYILWEERYAWVIVTPGRCDPEIREDRVDLTDEVMERILTAPLSEFWTDADTKYEWRPWKEGDRIRPLGMKGSRLVSEVLAEGKIPNYEKRSFHVLAIPGTKEVLWIPDLKRSRECLVNKKSSEVVRITVR